jgi:hypothetical protein
MDFTNALKSCSSENIAFIHIDSERYYRISPRFPYVYVNEYLQSLPKPLFLRGRGVDVVDWLVAGSVVALLAGGLVAVLVKMQLLVIPHSCFGFDCRKNSGNGRNGHGDSGTGSSWIERMRTLSQSPQRMAQSSGNYRNSHNHSHRHNSNRKKNNNDSSGQPQAMFSRIWGAMGWYRHPLYAHQQSGARSAHDNTGGYLFIGDDDSLDDSLQDVDEDIDDGEVELVGAVNTSRQHK